MTAALVSSLLSLLSPAIVRYILSTALPAGMFMRILQLLSLVLVVYLIQAGATYIRIKWGHYLGVWMENRMRFELFSHLQCLSFSYFDRTKTGTIMSRITNDLFNIAEVAHHCPEDFLISIATIVGAYAFMFSFSWELALVSVIPLPVMLLYGIHFNHRLKERNRAIRKTIADIQTASGVFLDWWGERVGVSRYLKVKDEYVRFDDDYYRFLLSYRAICNISDSTAATMNRTLSMLTSQRVFVVDYQDMSIQSIVVVGNISDLQAQILETYGLLNRPAGVLTNFLIIYPDDKIFGFDGQELHPFDQGVFNPGRTIGDM